MASEEAMPVELYVYDLTHGLASVLSPAILGHQIEAVWHTAIVVYGREYFYGGSGITSCAPGSTQLGAPLQVERLGETYIPFQVFLDYVQGLATTTYSGDQYQLLSHNCNNFSDEVAQFLCGARVPKHILTLPERALPGPLRAALASLLESRLPSAGQPVFANGVRHLREDSPEYVTLNDQIAAARLKSAELSQSRTSLAEKLARKERRRQKKKLRQRGAAPDDADEMAETAAEGSVPVAVAAAVAGPSVQADEPERRHLEPPVVYRDIDAAREFEALVSALSTVELSTAEQQSVEELRQYMVLGEGCWALGDDFMPTVGRLLTDAAAVPVEARTCVLRCLAACALRDDVTLLLHQDRRTHTLTNYAHGIDRLETSEQQALALFMCNLFECVSSSEWLLYISEWEHNGQPLSNIRVTTKVAVHSLLSEDALLKDIGSALMHNIAVKEVKTVRCGSGKALRGLLPKHAKSKVFDDVCVELALALLQFLAAAAPAPDEEPLYRSVRALARLAAHSADVPQLLHMLQLDPNTFRGTSQRVDEQIDKLMTKVK